MALNRQVVLQVTMPALLVALTMLGTSLLGIRSINHLQADRDKIVSEHVRSLQAAQDLETELRHIRFHSFIYVMDMTPTRWAKVERDQKALHSLLGSLDIFSFWTIALLSIGFAAAARVKKGQAAGVIVALWAVFILGKAGFAAIF